MLYLLGTLRDDPRLFLLLVLSIAISLLIGLSFHEFSHALVADALGDSTPRRQGRLSLNPRAHLDPMGALLLVLAGFGWGKPVMFNPLHLRVNPNLGVILVKFAGPLSNFLLAAALAVPLKLELLPYESTRLLSAWSPANYLAFLVLYIVFINVTLGVFNLLPFPPLDGGGVAVLLPGEIGEFFRRMERERWGLGILFLLLFLPSLTGGAIDPVGAIINPIRTRLLELFLTR